MRRETARRLLNHPAFAPGVLAAGIVLRLAWVFTLRSTPIYDGWWYHLRAMDLAAGRGYAVDGLPTAFWPPGYPLLLGLIYAGVGASPLAAQITNVVLAAGGLIVAWALARRLTGSIVAANLTLALLAFHPNAIAYSSLLVVEPLFTTLLLAAVWAAFAETGGPRRAAAAGLLFGLACLVKPQALFVPLLVLAARPRRGTWRETARPLARDAAVLYACCALVILPWTARNWLLSGKFIPISTNGGFNLFVGNNPHACGSYFFNDPMRRLLGVENEYQGRGIMAEIELDRKAGALARAWVREHPGRALALLPRKFAALYKGDVDGFYYQGTADHRSYLDAGKFRGRYRALAILAQLYYMGLLGLFCVALAARGLAWARRRPAAAPVPMLCLAVLGYFTALYLIFFGVMRFHYPLVPWIAIVGAAWAGKKCDE